MQRETGDKAADPGVPEALPRVLIRLRERIGAENVDRLWIFPPSRRGRREQGLIAVSTFLEGEERRSMVTVSYRAERTGTGVSIEPSFMQEGEAPADRFPGVMQGVVQRGGGDARGEPREVDVGGSAQRFEDLLGELDADMALEGGAREDRP